MAKVVDTTRVLDIGRLEIRTTDIEGDGRTEKRSIDEGGTSTNDYWISVYCSKGCGTEGHDCEHLKTLFPKDLREVGHGSPP
jgi:hypothetical protein